MARHVTVPERAGSGRSQPSGPNERVTTSVSSGHEGLYQSFFPSTAKGSGTSSGSDYEQYGYDADGNVTSRQVRDGRVIGYAYGALSRLASKDVPTIGYFDNDVSYGYDNLRRVTAVHDSASHQQSFGYDALGRKLSEGSNWYGTSSAVYDLAGRRTRLNWRDGFFVTYEYLTTGEMTAIRENGSFVLASYGYDERGRRSGISRGNGTSTSYGFDAVSRLATLTQDIGGGSNDQTLGFSYNPASQITQNTRSNDVFAWTNHYNVDRPYAANGLNQYTQSGSVAPTYDGRGNLTSAGSTTYSYTTGDRLAMAAGTRPRSCRRTLGAKEIRLVQNGLGWPL